MDTVGVEIERHMKEYVLLKLQKGSIHHNLIF